MLAFGLGTDLGVCLALGAAEFSILLGSDIGLGKLCLGLGCQADWPVPLGGGKGCGGGRGFGLLVPVAGPGDEFEAAVEVVAPLELGKVVMERAGRSFMIDDTTPPGAAAGGC